VDWGGVSTRTSRLFLDSFWIYLQKVYHFVKPVSMVLEQIRGSKTRKNRLRRKSGVEEAKNIGPGAELHFSDKKDLNFKVSTIKN